LQTSHPDNFGSVSIYKGELTLSGAMLQMAKLKKSFPNLTKEFYEILMERVKENHFTDQRLTDSINNLIDNFTYPNPTIANIIGFDKRVKLLTYSQLCDIQTNSPGSFKDYCKVKRNGKIFWINRAEKEQFNIGDEI